VIEGAERPAGGVDPLECGDEPARPHRGIGHVATSLATSGASISASSGFIFGFGTCTFPQRCSPRHHRTIHS
jgi:hypothetical protein